MTTQPRRRRPRRLWRANPNHSYRVRRTWRGTRYEFYLPPDLSPEHAYRAFQEALAQVRAGGPLENLVVTVRVGARDVTIRVPLKVNGVPVDKSPDETQPPLPALRVDEALVKFVEATALSPRPGRHRKGPNGTKVDARSDRARATALGCWWMHEQGGFRLGAIPVTELRGHHLEQVLRDQAGRPASTHNKYTLLVKNFAEWLTTSGMVEKPIVLDREAVRRDTEARRTRRLSAEEYARLTKHCAPHLRALVDAALETACRLGELLGMTWGMVDEAKRMIRLPASLTKTSEAREIPITSRLKAILEMRRLDPAGERLPDAASVFGDEVGRAVKSIKTAWGTATRKAGLVDLHFHDLRREAASRFLEAGLPLHHVSLLLGHRNISTTSIYLSASSADLRRAFDALEKKQGEAPPPPAPAAAGQDVGATVN